MMAPKLDVLRSKSSEELEALYDQNTDNVIVSLNFIRQEIEWRKQAEFSERTERMTQSMESMTKRITKMTSAILWLTAVAVVSTIVSLVVTIWPFLRGMFQ